MIILVTCMTMKNLTVANIYATNESYLHGHLQKITANGNTASDNTEVLTLLFKKYCQYSYGL